MIPAEVVDVLQVEVPVEVLGGLGDVEAPDVVGRHRLADRDEIVLGRGRSQAGARDEVQVVEVHDRPDDERDPVQLVVEDARVDDRVGEMRRSLAQSSPAM